MSSSSEISIGLASTNRTSSRVLKPPGGGHSDIFAPPEVKQHQPRPKYDQQNSSNLNCVMNTTDPNIILAATKASNDPSPVNEQAPVSKPSDDSSSNRSESNHFHQKDSVGNGGGADRAANPGRVPPGGFSSGFW